MLRNYLWGLSLRWKTSVAQKGPSRLIDKLVSYILHARHCAAKYNYSATNVIAMDEMPVWSDVVSDTIVNMTGAREVTVKSAGHEECRVSVCLATKAEWS